MDAGTLDLKTIFGQDRRHVVPLYQRPYVWEEKKQWELLWDDIETVAARLLAEAGTERRPLVFVGTDSGTGATSVAESVAAALGSAGPVLLVRAGDDSVVDAWAAADADAAIDAPGVRGESSPAGRRSPVPPPAAAVDRRDFEGDEDEGRWARAGAGPAVGVGAKATVARAGVRPPLPGGRDGRRNRVFPAHRWRPAAPRRWPHPPPRR